jgi:serine protease
MRTTLLRWLAVGLLVAAAGSQLGRSRVTAQSASPYDFILMTRERIEALTEAWNDRLDAVPGEVLVKFKAGMQPAQQTRALSVVRGAAAARTRWIGDVLWMRAEQEPDPNTLARMLAQQPEVEYAQPNYLRRFQAAPNDPSYSRQWNFDLIDLPRAWDINRGANNTITIAVIDSGINTVTSSLTFRLWTGNATGFQNVGIPYAVDPDISGSRVENGRDFVFWTGPVLDMDGHGTHVAGTALEETNNNLALAGVAYQARLLPLKVCLGYWDLQLIRSANNLPGFVDPNNTGFCDDAAVVAATRFAADNGAQVLNLSLGGPTPAPAQLDALRYAVSRGSFAAIAGGNGFEDGNAREYPAAYAAQIDGAVAVAAVGRSSRRAYYSSTGDYIELAAPGGDVRDGGLAGVVYQAGLNPSDADPFTIARPRFDRYVELPEQGTSMASPHVAGVAALLYSQGVRSPAAIEAALKATAQDLGAPGRDNEYGFGLINARSALRGLGVAR